MDVIFDFLKWVWEWKIVIIPCLVIIGVPVCVFLFVIWTVEKEERLFKK